MKRFLIVAFLVVTGGFYAGNLWALPTGTWASGVTLQNLADTPADAINIQFYDNAGNSVLDFPAATPTSPLAAGGAKTWYIPTQVPGLPASFTVGSAVVSSSSPVAAIVNTQLPSGSNPARVGTSTGISTPQTIVYAPQVMKGYYGWNSYCAVQNTSGAAENVTAYFYNSTGLEVDNQVQSIPAYSSFIFDQSANADLVNGYNGSAKFVSTAAPLAVVCNFYNTGASADTSQFHSYNGMGNGGDVINLPRVVKNYYGYQSGLKIQNIGTESLTVEVKYNFGGTEYSQTSTPIGLGQAWGPYMGDTSQLPASMAGVSGSGSAVVSIVSPNANKKVIAIVNEDNRVSPAGRGITYEGALVADGASKIVFPQVTGKYYGYSSGIQVAKVEAGPSTCTATYSPSGGVTTAIPVNFTLTDAAPSWSKFTPEVISPKQDYNGAVTVSCTGAKVVGIANISYRFDIDPRYGNITGDSFACYRGLTN
jgi:hypothetical protein